MFRNLTINGSKTKTLEFHSSDIGWYFTVYIDAELLFQSLPEADRVKVTQEGFKYLDTLNKIGYFEP